MANLKRWVVFGTTNDDIMQVVGFGPRSTMANLKRWVVFGTTNDDIMQVVGFGGLECTFSGQTI